MVETDKLAPYFEPYRELIGSFVDEANINGISPLQAALKFVLDLAEIDRIIVGICSAHQLSEISEIINSYFKGHFHMKSFPLKTTLC